MNKTVPIVLGLTAAVLVAGMLIYLLFGRNNMNGPILLVLIAVVGIAVMAIALGVFFGRGAKTASPETAAKNRKSSIWAVIAAIFAQMPFLGDWIERTSKSSDAPIIWISVGSAVVIIVLAVVLITRRRSQAPGRNASVPWVVVLIMVMVVLGIGGTIVAIAAAPSSGGDSASIAVPIIGMIVMLFVAVLVFRIFIVGTRSSAYALPDVLPAAGPPTDPHFVRGGYWDGTKLLNKRVWGIPVPVTGRGYFIQGQGKAWLADEVLAFHLYLTRNPLVIPYGIIHSINTKKLILRKNHFPGPGMSIIWGRPELPMVTTIQVTQNKAENELWAQEIMRRAGVWKDKMAATQAEGAM